MTIAYEGRSSADKARFEHEIKHGKYLANSETETQWGWGTPAGRARLKRRAEMITHASAISRGVNVLEVGCGTGLFTERFAATECQLTAVDISPDLLEAARNRVKHRDNVKFELRPFEECHEIGPFDAIVGSSVLHHLDLCKALGNMFELLKPGGKMVFAEPNHLNPQVFLERKCRKLFPYVSPDETAFYRCRIVRDLEQAGFSNISVQPFDWLHPFTPARLISLVSRVGRICERIPLVREFSGSLLISASKPR